jgi:hypothetical protein
MTACGGECGEIVEIGLICQQRVARRSAFGGEHLEKRLDVPIRHFRET